MLGNRDRRFGRALAAAMVVVISVLVAPFASTLSAPVARAACGVGLVGDALPAGGWSVSGAVTDPDGNPLAGIRVYIAMPATGGIVSVLTDGAGAWSLAGLGDGSYQVRYFDETGPWQPGYYSSTGLVVDSGLADEIVVSGGDVAGIDVALPEAQTVTITGRVTDHNGTPVENAEVGGQSRDLPVFGCAATDANGDYSMTVVLGTYRVAISDPNGNHAEGWYDVSQPGNFGTDAEAATILVADTALSGIDIQFPFRRPICDSGDTAGPLPAGPHALSGRVTGSGGGPLEGVIVYVESPTDGGRGGVQTDANGEWTFPDLGDSSYIVSFFDASEAWQSGYWTATGLEILESDAEHIDIAGAPVAGIDIALPAEQLVEISGRITDTDGTGVAGIQVDARSRDLPLSGCTTSDANGDYTLLVRLGSYVISTADGSMTYPDGHYDATNPPTHFTTTFNAATPVLADQDVAGIDIQFPPTYAIGGRVVDGSGSGLEGINVIACFEAAPLDCPSSTTSDANGEYSVNRLLDGAYVVRVSDGSGTYRDGFRIGTALTDDPASADVFTIAGADVGGVNVTTHLNARILGRVTVAGGAPLEGANVQACDNEIGLCGVATTDANGDFATTAVPPGSYTVQFQDPVGEWPSGYYGPADTGQPVVLVADPTDARTIALGDVDITGIDIELPVGYRISGTIEASGVGAEGRAIDVCLAGGACVASALGEVDGSFQTSALLPGSYELATFGDLGDQLWYVAGSPASPDRADATSLTVAHAPVTGILFDATEVAPPVGTPTPAGTDVPVALVDPATEAETVSLVFDEVTAPGETSLTTSTTGPATPAGFQVGDPPTYFEIETTATFSGLVEVCINYSGVSFADETLLRLLHFDETLTPPAWDDVTTSHDVANDVICGLTASFSAFGVFQQIPVFGGFEAPVDGGDVANQVKAGRGVPVTFGLGGDFGLAVLDGSPVSQRTDCGPNLIDQIETTTTAGSSELQYDASTDLYTYVWKTDKSWAGQCRTLLLTFADGTVEDALFRFTK